MKNPFAIALVSALITAGAIKAAPALGQVPSAQPDTHVSLVRTSDIDLGTSAGQRRLQQRLAHAAREVCGTPSDADLAGQNAARECREEAIARASGQRDGLLAAVRRGAVIAVTASR